MGIQGSRTIALGINGTDQQVEIKFSPEEVIVGKASHLSRTLTLSEHQMVRLVFGPGSPGTTVSLPSNAHFLEALFPVDFYIWDNETV